MIETNKIHQGDCLEVLKTIPDNSIDAVVTDPPYGLSFMGKKWDYEVPSIEIWKECLRVLKPGGYLLSFAGTRTQHRMAVNIEDAGFEIRDMIAWVYGSGFPKSLNIGIAVNKLETKEWSKIGKALDNIVTSDIIKVWKNNSNNVKIVETQSKKNLIEIGICMPKSDFAQENATENLPHKSNFVGAIIAEMNLCEALQLQTGTKELIATLNAEKNTKLLQSLAKSAEKLSQSQNLNQSLNIFTAECNVKEWLNENTEVNHRVDEALKTLRGNKKYSSEEITNVLCAELTDSLKLIILNQSKTFQTLDTNQKTECASAINVIITKYTAELLISNMVNILKGKAVDKLQGNEREDCGKKEGTYADIRRDKKTGVAELHGGLATEKPRIEVMITKGTSEWEGWGTALKPSWECITVARKPLSEKTVAENVLKWGTGGINIDGCRVGTEERTYGGMSAKQPDVGTFRDDNWKPKDIEVTVNGRFPANLIHDSSDEVVGLFPQTKSGASGEGCSTKVGGMFGSGNKVTSPYTPASSGSAARFFYCAKASKSERGEGNIHCTVKPIALMEYLIKLVSKEGAIILDPFAGSGTTGIACVKLNRKYILIEREAEYVEISRKRIELEEAQGRLL